ncbi:NAD(P)/FAD-dependent oxidoreductase [Acuticoccus kandeliae]|uniref:NAD(P)/FAD-dependent oxidoreductase n=1 Tax=Acuticoccus kandeliae TaxID=2073160 RepID=UPI0013008747|nr:FAD-binding oxidoreductase [Acuticoccus kandeliae]
MWTLAPSPLYATPSGWNALLPKRQPRPPLTSDIRVDFLVVGAGYAGLGAARRLGELDPDARIAVLDAGVVGEGAAGRNSGFMQPVRPSDAAHRFNGLADAGHRGLDLIRRLIEENGIDCGLERAGALRAAATARGEGSLRASAQSYQSAGMAVELLDREELQRRIGTPYYHFALFTPESWFVQPAALIRGLAETLPASVELYEKTPITHLTQDAGGWTAITDGGSVRAKTVILAANAFARQLGFLKDRTVAVYTYAGLTPTLSGQALAELGEDPVWGVVPALKFGTTMRKTRDGRLLVRSAYSYEREASADIVRRKLLSAAHKRYPLAAAGGFEHQWGGVIAITLNDSPFCGEVTDGLYAILGCNGSGIMKFTLLGHELAELIKGANRAPDSIAAYGQASRMPPEPFRSIGYHARTAYGVWRTGKDV